MLTCIADVIDAFGGPAAYAHAVGMSPGAAKQARRRGSLSARWFASTAAAARERDLRDITETSLALMAAADRTTGEAA